MYSREERLVNQIKNLMMMEHKIEFLEVSHEKALVITNMTGIDLVVFCPICEQGDD